jgi:hypothetical protein
MRPLELGSLALIALCGCPSSTGSATCAVGGPNAAAANFDAYLQSVPDCTPDAGCALVVDPCGLSDSCGLTQVAVPLDQEAATEEEASKLTAEECPVGCPEVMDAGEALPQINSGNLCNDLDVVGTNLAVCVAGRCTVQVQPILDAGVGTFESLCGFGCDNLQFCDISSLEVECGGPTGVFKLNDGGGMCAPVANSAGPLPCSSGAACSSSLSCGEDAACVFGDGGFLPDAGPGVCESCANQFDGDGCPPGCSGPVDELRNCRVCLCSECPPGDGG